MKKIILLALTAFMMVECHKGTEKRGDYSTATYLVDSCEYYETFIVGFGYQLIHKHNCKFCAERRKQELQEIVRQLKEK